MWRSLVAWAAMAALAIPARALVAAGLSSIPGVSEALLVCVMNAEDPAKGTRGVAGTWAGPAPAFHIAKMKLPFLHALAPNAGFKDDVFLSAVDPSAVMQESKPTSAAVLADASAVEPPLVTLTLWALKTLEASKGQATFVDVGADIGAYTVPVARAGFQVVAFEPMPFHRTALQRSLCMNPDAGSRVMLLAVAMTDAEGECAIGPQLGRPARTGVFCGDDRASVDVYGTVLGTSFDAIAARGIGLPVSSVMRIDMPGLEAKVLQGSMAWLSSEDAPAMVQITVSARTGNAVLNFMRRRGYLLVSRAGHSNGTWTPTAHPIEDVTAIDGVPAALAVWRAALDAGEPWARRDEAYVEEGAMGLVRGVMIFVTPAFAELSGMPVARNPLPRMPLVHSTIVGDDWSELPWEVAEDDYPMFKDLPVAFMNSDGGLTINMALLPPACRSANLSQGPCAEPAQVLLRNSGYAA